jgi:tRNA dimethylallyltransferase
LIQIAIKPEDKQLHRESVAKRFNKMIDDGLVSEVENILNMEGMSSNSQSMKSVGYRQVCEFLEGGYNFDDMIDKAINSTRQLAKRQMTWISGWSDLVLLEKNRTLPKSVEDLILNNS